MIDNNDNSHWNTTLNTELSIQQKPLLRTINNDWTPIIHDNNIMIIIMIIKGACNTFAHWQRNDQSIILMVGLFEQWETE